MKDFAFDSEVNVGAKAEGTVANVKWVEDVIADSILEMIKFTEGPSQNGLL
jgi:hypothetical protein